MTVQPPLIKRVGKEVVSLLYWSMLAACTVGPGTVVTCARAGFEQDLQLGWALVFATIMAYIMQEGSARLTISSGRSLGECLRIKYRHLPRFYDVAILCWVVGICVFFGNTLYECNCWAGGMSAIYILPGASNTVALRVPCCFGYAIIVYGLLFWDKTHHLSVGLGVVLIGMAVLFLVVVIKLGLDWERFGLGFIPNFPKDSSNIVLSLVGTTTIGFNLFLGSSMAQDSAQNLASAQRGIAFSVCGAFVISILIMIVGDGVTNTDEDFSIESLAQLIEETVGAVGLWFFCIGFIAAAISSMLAVPLGAALTVDSMFTIKGSSASESGKRISVVSLEQNNALEPNHNDKKAEAEAQGSEVDHHKTFDDLLSEAPRGLHRWIYQGIMLSMILISTAAISANAPTVTVIQIAQIFNGCLLPFFSVCLLLCLNDERFMGHKPQKWWANLFLIAAVTITMFLAFNVLIQNIFASVLSDDAVKFAIAGSLAPVVMIALILTTSLKRDILRSFGCCNAKCSSRSSSSSTTGEEEGEGKTSL